MRATRLAALVTLSLSAAGLVVSAACSEFAEEPPAAPDGAPDGDPLDAATDVPGPIEDAGVKPKDPRVCPPAAAATRRPETWARKTIYAAPPTEHGFPFGIAPDETHVTWVEQPQVQDGNPDTYDGFGSARVLRAPKSGAPPKVLARDQLGTIDLVVQGGFVYWTAKEGTVWQLRRQPLTVSCDEGPCPTPEVVASFPGTVRVSRLVRDGNGAILALEDQGKVYYVGDGAPDGGALNIISTNIYPALTASTTHLYMSSGTESAVVKRSTISANPVINDSYLTMPPLPDGGSPGPFVLATDCSSLWSIRISAPNRFLEVHDFTTPGSVEQVVSVPVEIYDVTVDAKYAYLVGPLAGMRFTDRTTKTVTSLYSGNVWRISTDDDGVYFGVHGGSETGNIYMFEKQ